MSPLKLVMKLPAGGNNSVLFLYEQCENVLYCLQRSVLVLAEPCPVTFAPNIEL